MSVTRAAGIQNYSTDSSNFIPEIFAAKLVKKFYANTVFGAIANTDYEGEIKSKGDVVHIRTRGAVTIGDYEIGGGLGTAQRPTSAGIDLAINKAKYYNVALSDIDALQSDVKLMDEWSDDAAKNMKITIDTDILANVFSDVAATNAGATAGAISGDINLGITATPVAITKANIVDYILEHMLVLDEANVDEEGRWMVLPAWACQRIKLSDLKDASITGDTVTPLRNGKVGMIDRCTIYSSNLVNNASGKFDIISGHSCGLTFATQLVKNRIIPDQEDFQDLLQGLQVYGYKVINDVALTHGVISKG